MFQGALMMGDPFEAGPEIVRRNVSTEYQVAYGAAVVADLTMIVIDGVQTVQAIRSLPLSRQLNHTQTCPVPIRGAGAADNPVIDSCGVLRRRSDIPGQTHHLNQDAAFRSRIAQNDGVAIKLEGNAFTDVGAPHYNAHESKESFWDIYRRGGMDAGNLPTNRQYNRVLYNGLQESGLTPAKALRAVQAAKAQQIRARLRGTDLVPQLPGRINQVPRGN